MRKVKWGVIGCGGIADRRTLPGMMLAENVDLVAVMDVSKDAAERCKEKYNAKYAFTNIEDLLAIDEIEAVYIATPVVCHKEQATAAAKAGKHILLEKPIALTVDEGEKLIKKSQETGAHVQVGQVIRFWDEYVELKKIIEEYAAK